jgi:hypothetical protein
MPPSESPGDMEALQAKIGQLTLENAFLEGSFNKTNW